MPDEPQWITQRHVADPTSGSLRGGCMIKRGTADLTGRPLRKVVTLARSRGRYPQELAK